MMNRQSRYLTMRDGVRIAIDVYLPDVIGTGFIDTGSIDKLPTALELTRYHRSSETQRTQPERDSMIVKAQQWNAQGYAYVVVDARGTGASFGRRTAELSRAELEDYCEVTNWIAEQPWSNKKVGAFGVSYMGDTAELLASLAPKALKAVAPLFSDFDPYEDLLYPGGVFNHWFGHLWFVQNNALDELPGWLEIACHELGVSDLETFRTHLPRVKAVDGPDGAALREEAILEHANNIDGVYLMSQLPYKDDRDGAVNYLEMPFARREAIEKANIPMLVLAGWQDAGTAAGALSRLAAFKVHQEVYLGAWSHGGGFNTDPFTPPGTAPQPSSDEQFALLVSFFDRFVKGDEQPDATFKRLHYATNNDTTWRTLEHLPTTQPMRWCLAEQQALELHAPTTTGSDDYLVDFKHGTGTSSRWRTQMGGGAVRYGNGAELDLRRLCYTSEPLAEDMRVFGFPTVTLWLSSSTADGAIYAYLEDVAPDGRVTLVTEGQLRLLHRNRTAQRSPERTLRTPRTFFKADALPMPTDTFEEIVFDLIPTATLFRRGHCLRLALAGHDADHFARYAEDSQRYRVARHPLQASLLELPLIVEKT
jgi:uncharacterized protein